VNNHYNYRIALMVNCVFNMKIKRLTVGLLTISFLMGFAAHKILASHKDGEVGIKKVTGIGGIFFKSKNPKATNEWYKKHLGFATNPYGTSFEWRFMNDSSKKCITQWNPFAENTTYFAPSKKDFMINYTVENLDALVLQLRKEEVEILDTVATYDYGKFIHIMDLDGNKIQLWEPM
jgi:predicted enzyme related to lactoylglutathione lyase